MIRYEMIPVEERLLATSIDLPDAFEHAEQRYPVVIITHGLAGHRIGSSYYLVELAKELNSRNVICVRYDQSGCGESSGEIIDHSIPRMKEDLTAIRAWVFSQSWCDTKRVGYLGVSMGALPTIAVDAEHPSRGIALWAPIFDMPRVFHSVAKTGLQGILEQQGWFPYQGLRIGRNFVEQLDAIKPSELLSQSSAPILLCHSQIDEVATITESEDYEKACRTTSRLCQLIRFENANHSFSDWNDRRRLLSHTIEFFEEQMKIPMK